LRKNRGYRWAPDRAGHTGPAVPTWALCLADGQAWPYRLLFVPGRPKNHVQSSRPGRPMACFSRGRGERTEEDEVALRGGARGDSVSHREVRPCGRGRRGSDGAGERGDEGVTGLRPRGGDRWADGRWLPLREASEGEKARRARADGASAPPQQRPQICRVLQGRPQIRERERRGDEERVRGVGEGVQGGGAVACGLLRE
jgi:hypothetical protein